MSVEDDLLWYLTWRVQQEEGIPAKTRLVKFFYLIDLSHVRDRRTQATGFRWRFYHYGPYATEVEAVITRQLGDTISQRGSANYFGDRMYIYRATQWPPDTLLPDYLRRYCDDVCHRWATADLNDLLSYVYFETPPMRNAERGDFLRLEDVLDEEWPKWYAPLRPPELAQAWEQRLGDWRREFDKTFPAMPLSPPPRRDGEYERFILEEPESAEGNFVARGRLQVGALEEDEA